MKISRELFETIYPEYAKYMYHDRKYTFEGNRVSISLNGQTHFGSVSYNDFFFKCKEYARDRGYELRSWNNYCACIKYKDGYGINQKDFQADSEQQAVFDATDWLIMYLKGEN